MRSRNLVAAARTALLMPRFNLLKQMSESKAVIGLNVLTLWDELGTRRALDASRSPSCSPTARSDPWSRSHSRSTRAGDAHRFISERRNVGKVVLTP